MRRTHRDGGDRGSVTPLLLGFAVILLLLIVAVGAVGSVIQGREALQDLCDGAAATAGNAVRPGATDAGNQLLADTAVGQYLHTHSGEPPAYTVTVDADVAQLSCRREMTPSVYGLVRLGPFTEELTVQAHSSPILHD